MRIVTTLGLAAAAGVALGLAACEKEQPVPVDKEVCWHAVQGKDGTIKFNRVISNAKNIETCAASLEAIRVKFLGLGGNNRELVGAYQGSWLFVKDEGIFRAERFNGAQYVLLVRTGDGRLAIPGAMPQ